MASNNGGTPLATTTRNSRELPDRTEGEHSALNFIEGESQRPFSSKPRPRIFEVTSFYEMNSHTPESDLRCGGRERETEERAERRKSAWGAAHRRAATAYHINLRIFYEKPQEVRFTKSKTVTNRLFFCERFLLLSYSFP